MRNRIAVAVACAVLTGPVWAQAQEWDWLITPYAFLPALDVDSTVAGQTVPVDMSFGDVWDSFDVLGFSIRGEAWKGAIGLLTDFAYVDLDGQFGPEDSVRVEIEEWFWDLLSGYRWTQPGPYRWPTTLDLTAGLRIHGLKQQITPAPAPASLGGSDDWVDLMIGARILRPVAENWLLNIRGDVGGFGITDGTDINWSLTGGAGWAFSQAWLLDVGYRVYGIEYETGQGPNNFGIDGIEHGLFLGVTWRP